MTHVNAIEARNTIKAFGQGDAAVRALDDVSVTIRQGEFFTLLGPSGCGKTTLLRLIAGFEMPSSGMILIDGAEVTNLPPNRRPVNTVFQSYALFPHLTVAENVGFALKMQGRPKAEITETAARMLALVKLEHLAGRKVAQLSGGQQQRVALARALAPQPKVLLLDEPLSALDLKLRQAMRDELRELQRATGITFVFVTHDQEEALDMSDRICVLGHGEIQHLGTPNEIYEDPENRFVADFIGETNFLDVEVIGVDGNRATVRTPLGQTVTTFHKGAVAGSRATLSLRPEKIGMEDQAASLTDTSLQNGAEVMEGRISARNYMGGYTHYTVDVGGIALRVSRRNATSHSQSFEIGRPVKIGFRHDSARVLTQ
ncbi:MAG TPA: spermidine/putrescine ABC transporter ATP-binding protein [Arenimonas sp.]|nr:spermidine/putrescine ABC transporter ATP-binding protein [Arenimonas sp.]